MSISNDTLIRVINRNLGHVGYTVADLGVRRQFEPGETKEITMEELRKLSYSTGGHNILEHYLIIDNKEAAEELLGHLEPEYTYTDEDIKYLLTQGTVEQLEDCLDFAPHGVIESVKNLAVTLKLNDVAKRKVIQQKTGFNVDKAIEIVEDTAEATPEAPKVRRSEPITEKIEDAPQRRTTAPEYKVTSIG